MVRHELYRFHMDVLLTFKPKTNKDPAPSDKLFANAKDEITDFVQCDESHIAILLNTKKVILID